MYSNNEVILINVCKITDIAIVIVLCQGDALKRRKYTHDNCYNPRIASETFQENNIYRKVKFFKSSTTKKKYIKEMKEFQNQLKKKVETCDLCSSI